MSTEAALQKRIMSAIAKVHPTAWIFHPVGSPAQMIGVPDLLVVIDGLMFAFEIKHQKPGESTAHAYGRASPQQRLQISRLQDAGAVAEVVLSPQEALDLITDRLDKSLRIN